MNPENMAALQRSGFKVVCGIRLTLPEQPRFSVVAAAPIRCTLTAAERIRAALMSLSSNLRSQQ